MLPCSKNSIPYPGKSFSFKLTKKPREIGLNCSLRNKNQKCHGQNFLQVRKVLRKRLHELSRRKSYRVGEKTWRRGKLLIAWLRFYLLIPHRPPPHPHRHPHPHPIYFSQKNTLSFPISLVSEKGKPREGGEGETSIFYWQHVKQSPYFTPPL